MVRRLHRYDPAYDDDGGDEPDYEAIFNDRREQKQADMEYDPSLNS